MTDVKLEPMTDIGMFQFTEKGIRGGFSYIADRYGKANNKYVKELWWEGTLKVYYVSENQYQKQKYVLHYRNL